MQNLVQKYVERFLHERAARHRLARVMLFLALAVGIGVYWQLHLSGAALTNEIYCGKEEHTHSEECYENVLICALEETEGHTHDETCYASVQTLICALEEGEEHTHSDACYQSEEVLTCQLEEDAGHVHTEECYEEQLVCGLEEHIHTTECMIDETADVESASDWLVTIPALSGDDRTDLVAVAKSQVGYTESTKNFALDADGVTHRGYTRYGAWYGNKYGAWDAMFGSFGLTNAGVSVSDFPQSSGAYAWALELSSAGLYREASDYMPEAGDLIFFDEDGDGRIDHVGIVSYVTDNSLQVIEGDSNDRVEMNTCALAGSRLVGYGRLTGEDEEAETETESGSDSVTEEEVKSETDAESEKDAGSETESAEEFEEKSETNAEPEESAEDLTDSSAEKEN
ncbi:MAG: CHAP domain-containing protein [Lachnospiraceae bacterium]|nr:CHAP domain-containing protein [Lachnospiraceae bacterium]